jgi:hypothetical protein
VGLLYLCTCVQVETVRSQGSWFLSSSLAARSRVLLFTFGMVFFLFFCWRQGFIFWASCSFFRGKGDVGRISQDADKAQPPPSSEACVYFTTIRSTQAPSQTG